jgi:hypothetical protein
MTSEKPPRKPKQSASEWEERQVRTAWIQDQRQNGSQRDRGFTKEARALLRNALAIHLARDTAGSAVIELDATPLRLRVLYALGRCITYKLEDGVLIVQAGTKMIRAARDNAWSYADVRPPNLALELAWALFTAKLDIRDLNPDERQRLRSAQRLVRKEEREPEAVDIVFEAARSSERKRATDLALEVADMLQAGIVRKAILSPD